MGVLYKNHTVMFSRYDVKHRNSFRSCKQFEKAYLMLKEVSETTIISGEVQIVVKK